MRANLQASLVLGISVFYILTNQIPIAYATTVDLNNPTEDDIIHYANGCVNPTKFSGTYPNELYFGRLCGASSDGYRSYSEWDVSIIPDGASITDVDFKYQGNLHNLNSDIRAMANKPSATSNAATLWTDICDGTAYVSNSPTFPVVGTNQLEDLGSSADADVQTALTGGDWFAIGFCPLGVTIVGPLNNIKSEEANPTPKPTLSVTYGTTLTREANLTITKSLDVERTVTASRTATVTVTKSLDVETNTTRIGGNVTSTITSTVAGGGISVSGILLFMLGGVIVMLIVLTVLRRRY